MNLSYNEIRQAAKLVDYSYKLTGKTGIWVEAYQDSSNYYTALFGDDSGYLPLTITQVPLNNDNLS